ncbi:MAG: adenylate/guanylate cyclase domain-containing protein, partial [Proteobacteria bacterium]|nr:adenylate/guanylate cyclase domain-containing protein [Pseudomonadota bacterium]
VELLNKYLSSMVDVIFHNQGTLDKFIGDAIMAFWGAPIRVSDHGKMAVKAALEMTKALEQLNADFVAQGHPPFKTGIGLHTGEVILGNIGSEKKLDYTIIGDNVNLTSRLEGLTKEYGVSLLISEETYKELDGEFICRIADHVKVKGKNEAIRIYSVIGMTGESTEESELNRKICRYSEAAFNKYLNRQFEEAMEMNIKLKKFIKDDCISEIFIKRCREYIQTPPPEEWDGIFTMKTK